MRRLHAVLLASGLGVLACQGGQSVPPGATVLFDVDFSSPANTVGAAPTVLAEDTQQPVPSKLPSQIFLGAPMVLEKLCGLEQQPAGLATAGSELGHAGLEFLLDQRYGHYHVALDVCIANLGAPPLQANEPQLAIFLDIPDAYALGFFDNGRLVAIDPARGTDAVTDPAVIGAYELNKPMRVALDFDLTQQIWSVAVDGAKLFEGKLRAWLPRGVRVVIRGNKANVAAIDDLVIWAENDLSKGLQEPLQAPTTGNEK